MSEYVRVWAIAMFPVNYDSTEKNKKSQEIKRVGSNFVIHELSSFWLGAESACELEEVKSVNENGFWNESLEQTNNGWGT